MAHWTTWKGSAQSTACGARSEMTVFSHGAASALTCVNSARALRTQGVEEAVHGVLVRPVDGVHQALAVVVDHDEQVAVMSSVGDLVDADAAQPVEVVLTGAQVGRDAGDDGADRPPRAPHQPARC